MSENFRGILGLFRSRKAWAALTGTIIAALPVLMADPGQTPQQRREQVQNFVLAASALWGAVVVMNGVEDAASKIKGPPAEPPAADLPPFPVQDPGLLPPSLRPPYKP